jgi:hypothetical protein
MVVTHNNSTQENGKLRIYIDLRKLNATTKNDTYPLPFIDEVLNTVVGYEAYSFLDGYLRYHQISISEEDKYKIAFVANWGVFIWKVMLFGVKMDLQHIRELLPKHLENIWIIL